MGFAFKLRVVCVALMALAVAPRALANSAQIVIYNNRYPTTAGQANQGSNCSVCHTVAPTLNPFGLAFKNSAAGPDSTNGLAQIEFLDSDGDGFANLHEILKFTLPGSSGSKPASANQAPVLSAIGNKTLNEGQTLNFTVTSTDEVNGLAPLLSVANLPSGATFTDNRNGSGTFNWVTDFTDGGTYSGIQFTANDGMLTDTETITITVNDTNSAPTVYSLNNQYTNPGKLLEFTIEGFDAEGAPLTYSATGLPAGASVVSNGDATGTFSWTPGPGDIGIYPNVTFTAEDDATQTDSVSITIFVTATPTLVFDSETPLNTSSVDDEVLDYAPDLATDGAGNWVAVWYISDTGLVMAARSDDNGATWSAPAAVSPLNGSDEAPQVATDGAGNWMVVWRTNNNLGNTIGDDLDLLYARSTNNGLNWTDATPLNPDADTDVADDRGANIECDGSVWLATWMTGTDVYAMRSTNFGDTWEQPDYLGVGYIESFPDTAAPKIAQDGLGHWIVVWSKGQPFSGAGTDMDIQFSRSGDGGASWSAQAALNTNAGSDVGDDHLPSISTDGAGVWIAVWTSLDTLGGTIGNDQDILMSRSLDNGATWSPPAPVGMDAPYDGNLWDYAPSIAADGRGTWVAAWNSEGALIRICYSKDAGLTWSFPIIQNEIHNDTTRLPKVFPDGDGNWLAVWETNENPNDTGYDFDLMIAHAYAGSEDGFQSADQDQNNAISLAELLRVIQFYNSVGYHCADNPGDTEDGYVPGPGANQSCTPYDTDYAPQNWAISLQELLRVIQFYNSFGYHYCPDDGTEDGYCPGP